MGDTSGLSSIGDSLSAMADLASRTMRSNSGSSAGLASEHSGGDSRGELEDDFDADLAVGGEVDLDARDLGTSGTGAGKDAMQALLASYYGLAMEQPVKREEEIDKADFIADSYTRRMLQREGLESLLFKDDELVQEVKRLDSDMQMLVYENYSKFISATDTIRKMKNNVNEMKSEMDSLVKNMEGIASRMQTVNSFLGGKRAKVDKLVAVRRLLKRLEFLFDLPINLTRYVQRQDYVKAVACYKTAIGILRQHAHVPSFKSIQRESDQIINSLKDDLQKKMHDLDTPAAQTAEYVQLLLDLGTPRAELQAALLKAYRTRFNKVLVSQQQMEEKKAKELASSNWEPSGGGPFSSYLEGSVSRLNRAFVRDFEEALAVYRDLFLEGNGAGGVKQTPAYSELLDTTATLFKQYFDILRRLFRSDLSVVAQSTRAERYHDSSASPVAALQLMTDAIRPIHHSIKDAGLLSQAAGLVQEVVQGLIFLEFRGLQSLCLKRLIGLYSIVPKTRPGDDALDVGPLFSHRDLDRIIDDVGAELSRTLESLQPPIALAEEELLAAAASKKGGAASGAPTPAVPAVVSGLGIKQYVWQFLSWFADAMEKLGGVTFRLTENDVVDIPLSSPPDSSSAGGSRSAASVRRRVYPERFFAHPSSFSSLIDSDSETSWSLSFPSIQANAQFVILLAVLALETQNKLMPKASDALGRVYPPRADGTASASATGSSKLSTDDMKACLSASLSRLVSHFVEIQGNELAGIISRAMQAEAEGEVSQATWGRTLLMRLDGLVKEIGTALAVPTQGAGLSGGRRGERPDLGRQQGTLAGRKGVHVDIERIFTVRVQVFGPVDLTLDSILLSLLKVAFKALVEITRQRTLTRTSYTQLQVDVQLVRQAVPSFVRESNVLDNLLEETLISGGERCVDSVPSMVDPSAIQAMVVQEYQRLLGGRR